MGVINRFFLFIYALAVGVLLAVAATVAFHFVPESVWINDLRVALARHEFFMGLGVFSLFSLYFILYALLVKQHTSDQISEDEVVLAQGKDGNIRVARDAVQNLAEKEAAEAHAVRSVRAEMFRQNKSDASPFRLELSVIMLVGADVATVTKDVTERIRRRFAKTFGISEVPISVTVTEITNAPVENQKRVV